MVSGGDRPTAAQNNPANISLTGGNGQNPSPTQAARYIPDMRSLGSTGQETMSQETAVPMAGGGNPAPESFQSVFDKNPVVDLTQKTAYPDRNILYGINDAIPMPSNPMVSVDSGMAAAKALYAMDPNNEDLRRVIAAKQGF
jgi:hypothetical protein